jgi:hypothetical protein
MNQLRVDDQFSNALRAELVSRVRKASPSRRRARSRLWLGAGVLAGTGLLGGIGAAAAGLFVTPGGQQVTPLSAPIEGTFTGTATVELGDAPEGATGIRMELTCLTPGRLEIGSAGESLTCNAADVGPTPRSRPNSWGVSELLPGQDSVTITADPTMSWRISAKYVNEETTDWGVNADGDTYGMENENGSPDMIAVIATNGKRGYSYRTELEEADGTAAMKTFKSPADAVAWQESVRGKTFSVRVYDVTGKTVIGEFVIERY